MAAISTEQMAALEQAAHWYTRLNAEDLSDAERCAWQQWLRADIRHEWAWQQAERLQQQLRGVPVPLARRTLGLAEQQRRTVLKGLMLLVGSAAASWGGYRQVVEQGWLADYQSAVGERLTVTLADGSQLLLNTNSAVDVRFDAQQRLLILRRGEILVTTASDPQHRPFSVQTLQGRVLALGTRFMLRERGVLSQVSVLEQRVRVTTQDGQQTELKAGQQCVFSHNRLQSVQSLDFMHSAWTRDQLIANDQRLGDFVAELGRYRHGWLRCDPAIASLGISGTFDLRNTDQVLRALASSLPIRIEQRTRYWVTLLPA